MPRNTTKTATKRTKVNELPQGKELTADQAKKVKGGVGMLLPAIQKVREAAIKSVDVETKKLER